MAVLLACVGTMIAQSSCVPSHDPVRQPTSPCLPRGRAPRSSPRYSRIQLANNAGLRESFVVKNPGRIERRRSTVTLHPSRGTRDGYLVRPPPGIPSLQARSAPGQVSPDYSRKSREQSGLTQQRSFPRRDDAWSSADRVLLLPPPGWARCGASARMPDPSWGHQRHGLLLSPHCSRVVFANNAG